VVGSVQRSCLLESADVPAVVGNGSVEIIEGFLYSHFRR
jgi:hypothetical protein